MTDKSKSIHYGWIIIIIGVITVVGSLGFGRFGYTMILPSMKENLNLTETQAGDLASVNMISYLLFTLFCGFLATKFGARIIKFCPIDGWKFSWFILAVFTFIISILCYIFLRNNPSEKGLIPIGGKTAISKNINYNKINKEKIKYSSIFKSFSVWHLAAIYVLFGFSYIIYATFFASYLIIEGNLSSILAGGLWSLIGIASLVSGFIWGLISDLIGRKYGLAIVYFLQFICFTIFGLSNSITGYLISGLLFALTAWSIPAIISAAAGDIIGPKLAPTALGFITIFFGIGQALGPFTAGRIADATGSFSLAFILAGIASLLIGAIVSLFIKSKIRLRDYNEKN